MTSFTATQVLGRFNLTTDNLTVVNCEYVIDDVIDYVNLMAGQSISNMAGAAGAKTATVTANQNAVIKLILSVMLEDVKAKASSSSTTLGMLSVSETISGQSIKMQSMINRALRKLMGSSFERA